MFDADILNNTRQTEMDKKLAVKFYKKAVHNKFRSKQEGRQIYDDIEYISIIIPGDNTTKIERPIKEEDKTRFEIIWDKYKKKEDDLQNGTPLSLLPSISPAQVENFKSYQIYTIEQLSGLSEKSIQKIPQARTLVTDANKFLEGDNYVKVLENKIESLEAELATLKEKQNESIDDNTKRVRRNGAGGKSNDGDRK